MARDIRRWRGLKKRVSLGAKNLGTRKPTTSRHVFSARELRAIEDRFATASVVSIGMIRSA
jgi:hypothetical protein